MKTFTKNSLVFAFMNIGLFYVPKIRGNININILQFIDFICIFFTLIN